MRRALLAVCCALALVAAAAPAASANIGGVFPTDDDGNTAIEDISAAQNLWAFTTSDVQGGDVCIVPASLADPGDGSLNCLHPAWGTSNRIIGVGSSWTLIETAPLKPGHWKLLADGGSRNSVDVFSNDFTVEPCLPADCDTRIDQSTAMAYKAAAGEMAIAMAGMKGTVRLLTKVAPDEPFDKFKTALNKAVKAAVSASPKYLRVVADKAARKLNFVTRIPSGPWAMSLAIANQVSSDALEMYLDIVHDPPQDYADVAQPEFDLPVFATGDADTDGLMLDLAQLTGYGAAGLTAYERYQQAALEGNEAGIHRQAVAMSRFDGELTSEMWSAAIGLDAWADKLEADPDYGGAKVVQEQVDDVRPFLERVRDSGLTADERQALVDADFSDAQIADVTAELSDVDLDDVKVDVPIQDLARSVAADLREQAPAFDAMAREAASVAGGTNSAPTASFDASPDSGAPPLAVTFTDTSENADDDPLTVTWDFGDGSEPATGASVTHTFAEGTFQVTETVSDGVFTASATRTIAAHAPNGPPVAAFTRTPADGDAPLSVSFDASGSSDPENALVAYDWDFGDGDTAQGVSVSHLYRTPGSYTAKLTVTDDRGTHASATAAITVRERPGNHAPNAVADALTTRQGAERTINVLANDSDDDGDPLTVVDTTHPAHGTAGCTPTGDCTYVPDPGFSGSDGFGYVVEDAVGARSTGHVAVTVNADNGAPTADAGEDRDVSESQTVVLDASGSSDDDGTIESYEWDFGDGTPSSTSEAPTVAHIYGRPGIFTAHLRVTDDAGATAEDDVVITVLNEAPSVTAGPYQRAPVGVTRSYGAVVTTGATEPTTVEIDFGDGGPTVTHDIVGPSAESADHAYAAAGTYTLSFTATDSAGATAVAEATVTVANAVAAAGPDRTADEGQTVHLGGTGTQPDDHTTVTWSFGDGSPDQQGYEVEHAYADEGTYTATVTVTDDAGSVSDSALVTVANVAPKGDISASRHVAPGAPASFRASARDPGVDDALTFAWDFGDGATAAGRKAEHTYPSAGTYQVKLRVEDGDGGSDTVTAPVVVGGVTGRRDSRGTDFWLAFPSNLSDTAELTLYIAGKDATTGRVSIPGLGFFRDFSVTPGQTTTVPLPSEAQLDVTGTGVQDRGVHLTAGKDVSVYGLNRIKFTTDAFLGLPVDALGTSYRVMSYDALAGPGPEAAIVATANHTTVTVTPTAAVAGDKPAGEPFDVVLDIGESYQMVGSDDLTGTSITADKPVAAFGGHVCAFVPRAFGFCDHLVEQLPPVEAWGSRFVTTPLSTRTGGDTFRILAAEDGTTVKVNGATVATLGAGEHHEQLIEGPATVDANKPILVAQYSNGSSFDNTVSDPFMVILPPFEQFQEAYTVTAPASGFAHNYVNLAVPTSATGSIRLDGDALPAGTFKAVGASGFSAAQVEVGPGDHRLEGALPFGVTVYGFDDYDSYGYSGGLAAGEVATVAKLALAPKAESLDIGSDGCVDATASTDAGDPVSDVRIDFSATGANTAGGFASTGADGRARFCYRGDTAGDDAVKASLGALTATASKHWRPVDRAPTAVDDQAATDAGAPLTMSAASLLANDRDPDGDPLSVTKVDVTPGTHGSVALAGGSVRYAPAAGFSGAADFAYTISDGRGRTASAHVRVTVRPPAKPVTKPQGGVKGVTTTAADLVLGCTDRRVVLEDVVADGSRVRLAGVADAAFVGRRASIVFAATGKVVARPKVQPDGSFRATAPLPPKRLRSSNRARYEARIGAQRSLKLKLTRRMQILRIGAAGGKVVITGRVIRPLATRRADRVIALERRVTCTKTARVGTTLPRANGTFRISVDAPAGQAAAVYRLRTKVRSSARSTRLINTFTLPRSVAFGG